MLILYKLLDTAGITKMDIWGLYWVPRSVFLLAITSAVLAVTCVKCNGIVQAKNGAEAVRSYMKGDGITAVGLDRIRLACNPEYDANFLYRIVEHSDGDFRTTVLLGDDGKTEPGVLASASFNEKILRVRADTRRQILAEFSADKRATGVPSQLTLCFGEINKKINGGYSTHLVAAALSEGGDGIKPFVDANNNVVSATIPVRQKTK